ncbi:LysR family transcriptional regulator [Sulfitobacter sp. 1A13679]|uniref:LysR family transcriptional regulator n=1 Tax=Sulfitobacter sp. 1A13679 TaxID=3368597 RepID=UPI003745F902
MQFRQIEAFRFVMITGTITGAAEIMAVSQPAASRLIGDLDASLGFILFDRVRGRLLPTEAAGRFFQGVENFMSASISLTASPNRSGLKNPPTSRSELPQPSPPISFPPPSASSKRPTRQSNWLSTASPLPRS